MRTDILFKDIRRSDYITDFINDKIEAFTDKLIPDKDLHITVRIEKGRQRTANRHAVFQCEITLKSGISDKTYKVVKQDRNVFRAIVKSNDALKILLAKNHDRLRHDRRRPRAPEVLELLPEITPPSPIAST